MSQNNVFVYDEFVYKSESKMASKSVKGRLAKSCGILAEPEFYIIVRKLYTGKIVVCDFTLSLVYKVYFRTRRSVQV